MDRICQNCKYRAAVKKTGFWRTDAAAGYCTLKAITVRDYNHCPKFEPAVSFTTLDLNFDANGSRVEE